MSEVVLLGVLDDDGALDVVPVSRLHDADHGRIFGDFLSVELPSELLDLRKRLGLTVDVDGVPDCPELGQVGVEDDRGSQDGDLQYGVRVLSRKEGRWEEMQYGMRGETVCGVLRVVE